MPMNTDVYTKYLLSTPPKVIQDPSCDPPVSNHWNRPTIRADIWLVLL